MQNCTANVNTIKLAQEEETGWGRRHRKLEQENQVNEHIYLCAGGWVLMTSVPLVRVAGLAHGQSSGCRVRAGHSPGAVVSLCS